MTNTSGEPSNGWDETENRLTDELAASKLQYVADRRTLEIFKCFRASGCYRTMRVVPPRIMDYKTAQCVSAVPDGEIIEHRVKTLDEARAMARSLGNDEAIQEARL